MLDDMHAIHFHVLRKTAEQGPWPSELAEQTGLAAVEALQNLSSTNQCRQLYNLIDVLEDTPKYHALYQVYQREYNLLTEQKSEISKKDYKVTHGELAYQLDLMQNLQFLASYVH